MRKLTSPFTEFGLWGGLLYAIDRLLARWSPAFRLYAYHFVAQPLAGAESAYARRGRTLQLREIRQHDPEVNLMPARTEIKTARFAQGALCLGAFREKEFIGYIWFQFRAYEEDEVRCTYLVEPAEYAVFDFDLYIFPQYRMGTAFFSIWSAASEYLTARGIRQTFSRLSQNNVASIRAHRRLGARRIASAMFLRAGRMELMFATIAPYLHLSGAPTNRARLRLCTSQLFDTRLA